MTTIHNPIKRYLLSLTLVPMLLFSFCVESFAITDSDIVGESAIVVDYDSGDILYSKNPDKKMYPASTTKIMTALLTLENLELDTNIVIDDETPFTEGSRIYLIEDEVMSIEDLLYALLLESANDAAVALAKAVSGDVDSFVSLMNERAKEIGATNTHFSNPNGLPDETHVTTVHDMALIAREAFENDLFREIVKTVKYVIDPTEKQPESRYLTNGNRFLWASGNGNKIFYDGDWIDIKYPIVDGIKTGYTLAAQQCLVTTASKGGRRVITVVFKSQHKSQEKNIFTDTRTLIDYGLDSFENVTLSNSGERIITADIYGGKENTLEVISGQTLIRSLPGDTDIDTIKNSIHLNENLNAPVMEGDLVGDISFSMNEKLIGTVPLLADKTVLKKTRKDYLMELWQKINWIGILIPIFLLYLARRTFITIKRLNRIKNKKLKAKKPR